MKFKTGDHFEIDYSITEKIYNGFIDLFNDRNPLHTDDKFAKEKNFAGKVMHGAILTGFLSNFIGEQLPEKNVIVLSYKISFARPVYMNSKLRLLAEVTDVFSSVNCVNIKYRFEDAGNVTVSKGDISIKTI